MADNQQPIQYKEFAKKIKQKYPEYKDVDDLLLSQKMVEKYPEYKTQVLFDEVKKKEPSVSSASQLPSSGYESMAAPVMQFGKSISKSVKPSIKEAALKDKKQNESYLGAVWNNVVGSASRLARGATRLAYRSAQDPASQIERKILDIAGQSMNKNLIMAKEKEYADRVGGVIEKARTSSSSKEYEKKLAEGFDITNGIGVSDLKALGTMIPQFIADMGLAVPTAGTSFAIQGYDDTLSMLDDMPEGQNISEGTRVGFGLGGAIVVGALEKLGLDNLIKNPSAKKYVTAKVVKETVDELTKKGVKVTAEQFEKAVADKASKLTSKELSKIVGKRFVKGGAIEGATEAGQEGAMDLLKLAANKIEGNEIFDEEEMKDTAAARYLNSFAAGGVLGGLGGATVSRIQNTQSAIKSKLAEAKTVDDVDAIVSEINGSVTEGLMTEEEAAEILPIVDNFLEVNKTLPETITGENKVLAVDLINERNKLQQEAAQREEQKSQIDPAFYSILDEANTDINERVEEINKQLADLSKAKGEPEQISQPIELTTEITDVTEQPTTAVSQPIQQTIEPTKEQGVKETVSESITDVGQTEPTTTTAVLEEVKPIKQLGTGANVYFETKKHRVNENLKEGGYLLNVGSKESELPAGNIKFDNANDAVKIAERIESDYPNGVPDALLLGKYVEGLKKELLQKPSVEQSVPTITGKEPTIEGLKRAEAKKIYAKIKSMDDPTDAEQIALKYLADGGKVSEDAINEVAGRVKRARLNTGERELKTAEAKARDYADKKGKSLDDIAHELWENSNQEVSEADIKDALMNAIGSHNTRLEAGKAYLERYSPEYQEEQYYARLAEERAAEVEAEEKILNEWLAEEGEREIELAADEEYINQLINQYETETNIEAEVEQPISRSESEGDTQVSSKEGRTEPTTESTAVEREGEYIGITHEQLNKVANELGFPEYETKPETFEEWDAEAKKRLANPNVANDLIKKYEEGKQPTPVEQRMMLFIIASLKAKINAAPTPELLSEFKRVMNLSNIVGGREVAKSLVARKGITPVEDTLADFLLMRENDKGYPLTEEQIKKETETYNKLKEAKDQLEERVKALEEENAKLVAEKGLNKAKAEARKRAKKSSEEYKKERTDAIQAAREALKKLRSGEQGLTAVAVPYAKELAAIAPHVKTYIKSLIEEGADKLDNVINDAYAEFKDVVEGLTKRDVLNIFNGEYDGEKGQTRNEKAAELRLLQREAALVKELQDARMGIEKETNPVKKSKTTKRIEELKEKIAEVRKANKNKLIEDEGVEDVTADEKTNQEKLKQKQKSLLARIEKLKDDLKNKNYLEEPLPKPKLQLDRKTQMLQDEVIKLERKIESERQKDEYEKMSKAEKALDKFNQIAGMRRVMQTAFDLSIPFRQGIMIALNPLKWGQFSQSFGNMIKSVFSDKNYNRLMRDIHQSEAYGRMIEDKIKFNELESLKNEERNEDFQKSFLYGIKIPILRQLITEPLLASQRAADAFLNTARFELYLKYEQQLQKQGITRESDPETYKKMAQWVMNTTGRGKMIDALEGGKMQKVVSNTFYGARLMAANINTLNPVRYVQMPKELRKEVMKDVLGYVTTTTMVMLAASAAGADVELDPDEPDFLQIRFGDKVYDITGGKAAYLRTFFRMTEALYSRLTEPKHTANKKVEYAGKSLYKFFRNKLSPNTGYVLNAATGYNTLGQPFNPYEIFELYPMYVDDFGEALKDEGVTSIATVLLPNLLGIGYGNYANQANKSSLEDLLERNMRSSEMNPEKIKNFKEGGRAITNKEFEKFAKERDKAIQELMIKLREGKDRMNILLDDKDNVVTKKFEEMTEEEIVSATNDIKRRATNKVKKELFGYKEGKEARKESYLSEKLSKARSRIKE